MILSGVTQPIPHLHSQNPCDAHYIGSGHTYVCNPAYNQTDDCWYYDGMNKSALPAEWIMRNSSINATAMHGGNNTYRSDNCTAKHHAVKSLQNYSQSVKYVCLAALMAFVAGYAIGYGPSK